MNIQALRDLENLIASAANEHLMPHFLQIEAHSKPDGSVVTEVDLRMQSHIQHALTRAWPQFELLGEEMAAEQQARLMQDAKQGLWIVDPLDGTSNFVAGIPVFAVSVALLRNGRVEAGVVYDPVRAESFSALRGQGAWLNGQALRIKTKHTRLQQAMALVDLKRLPSQLIERLATGSPYRSQRSFGSVALDWCWLAAQRVQIYLHGGQKLWDYAAGSLILAEAGGQGGLFLDYQGRAAEQLSLVPRIGIAATEPALFQAWLKWLDS